MHIKKEITYRDKKSGECKGLQLATDVRLVRLMRKMRFSPLVHNKDNRYFLICKIL